MKDINIKISKETRKVNLNKSVIGNDSENLQGNLVFSFTDDFVDGTARLEYIINYEKYYMLLEKENETYKIPIKNVITKEGQIYMQLVITEGVDSEEIPVFKSNVFYLTCNTSINAEIEQPEEYPEWIDIANEKLNEIDNLDIDVSKEGTTSTVTITKKDGSTKSVEINDGVDGQDGADGYTPQKGIDYFTEQDIEEIEGDILNEVYTKSETDTLLDEKADVEDIPDVSRFITKNVNDLTYYTLKANTGSLIDLEINDSTYVVTLKLKNSDGTIISTDTIDLPLESVVVGGTYDNATKEVVLSLEGGSEVRFSVADLVSGLQSEINSSNKLDSDLVDDSNSGNKFVTTSEKTTWNGKYTKPSSGIPKTDLESGVQTSLGKADSAIQSSDLTDYVKNTDYATSSKGGVVKIDNFYGLDDTTDGGKLRGQILTYTNYQSKNNFSLISKGTLENVITGKDLVNATDYASPYNGGVIKANMNGFGVDSKGNVYAAVRDYTTYQSIADKQFISKGTLENVIAGKELDLKQLSSFDSTKTQVLKNINGTLTWVNEP